MSSLADINKHDGKQELAGRNSITHTPGSSQLKKKVTGRNQYDFTSVSSHSSVETLLLYFRLVTTVVCQESRSNCIFLFITLHKVSDRLSNDYKTIVVLFFGRFRSFSKTVNQSIVFILLALCIKKPRRLILGSNEGVTDSHPFFPR